MHFLQKSQPTAGDVHVDRPLTNVSVAFFQAADSFIADKVFPVVPSEKQTDSYYTYDRGMFFRNQMEKRAEGTETKGVGYTASTANFSIDVFGLHHDVSDRRRANADSSFDLNREATELLTHQALIKREADWAAAHFATGKWTTDVVFAGGATQWNDTGQTSNPIEDVRTGVSTILQSTGFKPNTLILPFRVWQALLDNAEIIDRIKYSGAAQRVPLGSMGGTTATMAIMQEVFDVERILVPQSISNTGNEGAANAYSFAMDDAALLLYTAPSAGLYTPSAGYTFTWTGLMGTSANGTRIRRFRMEQTQSDRIEIEQAYDHKIVSADMGYFMSNVLA